MGATAVILDPPGYNYCAEQGFHFEVYGSDLAANWASGADGQLGEQATGLWAPPGSEWLIPKLLQMRMGWADDANLFRQFVLRKARWIFADGLAPFEWNPSDRPGTAAANQDNQWIVIPEVPAGTTPLDDADFAGIRSVIGQQLPQLITVAQCDTTPEGDDITAADYCPYLQFAQYPDPNAAIVFGWGPFGLLLYRNQVYLFRSPESNRQGWQLIGQWGKAKPRNAIEMKGTGTLVTAALRLDVWEACAFTAGPDELFLAFSAGAPLSVKLKPYKSFADVIDGFNAAGPWGGQVFKGGSWWVAASPGSKLMFQAQLTGYEFGDVPLAGNIGRPPIFDLGSSYSAAGGGPTATPELGLQVWVPAQAAADVTYDPSATGGSFLTRRIENSANGCKIDWTLYDAGGGPWLGDGSQTAGDLYLVLQGGSAAATLPGWEYLAPAVKRLQIRFAPVLLPRPYSSYTLWDTEFRGWSVDASLRDPEGKRLILDLWDSGVQALDTGGYANREGYPIEIWEDTNSDGVLDVLRAAGWIDHPDIEEHAAESSTRANPVRYYRLQARGMVGRLDDHWLHLPQLVSPGTDENSIPMISHVGAVAESILMSGIDTSDILRVYLATDPYEGTAVAWLPGTNPERIPNTPGLRFDSPWAPDDDETRLDYARRIAHEWRGWALYEQIWGRIDYAADQQISYQVYGQATIDAVIYRTQAEAVSAGVDGSYMLAEAPPRRIIERVKANVVRITGKSAENGEPETLHVIDRDTASITDVTAANFVGEPRTMVRHPKLAVGKLEMGQLARVLRLRASRRERAWTVMVSLAPWQIGASGIGANSVVTLYNRGHHVVTHLSCRLIARNVYRTELTLERLQ